MLLILLSWIYIAVTCINFGFVFRKIFRIDECHIAIHQILGLFLYTLLTSLVAFFVRINFEYYLFVLLLNIVLAFYFKKHIIGYFNSIHNIFKGFKVSIKISYLLLFFLATAQSATKPYLIDNESYYIQTIKWINEFGYVKGLANLHIFLGQNSSWHTLQAGFNFPFISDYFNDINGFVFITLGFLFIEKLNNTSHIQDYFLGLVLAFSLFFLQFVNAPSPDLIIFLLTPYVVYEFISKYQRISTSKFKILLSLVLFLCFIKVTMVVVSILILILFLKNFQRLKADIYQYCSLSVLILGLFVLKNYIVSGYAFYPTSVIDIFNVSWKLPPELLKLYKTGTYQSGMNNMDVSYLNLFEKLKFWLQIPKLHGLFNKIYVLLLAVFPFFIYKSNYKKPLFVIYSIAILQFIIIWLNSPQYRFFFVFITVLCLQIFVSVFESKKLGFYIVCTSLVLSAVPIFFPLDLNTYTTNKFSMVLSNFKLKNIIIPEENTKTVTTFSKESVEDFEFNSPSGDVFFWATGNGDLPCVNKQQVEYIKTYYHLIPQLRGNGLKDGFISKKTETSDSKLK